MYFPRVEGSPVTGQGAGVSGHALVPSPSGWIGGCNLLSTSRRPISRFDHGPLPTLLLRNPALCRALWHSAPQCQDIEAGQGSRAPEGWATEWWVWLNPPLLTLPTLMTFRVLWLRATLGVPSLHRPPPKSLSPLSFSGSVKSLPSH